jgi:polar amino acid transport system substrate-binding protein
MNFIKIIFLLSTMSLSALADQGLVSEDILLEKDKTILNVAIEEVGYFPFNYKENGEIKGFSIDVLNYIAANSKYRFEFSALPWPRVLYLVEQGKVDIILTLFKAPNREKKYHFIEPYYAYEVNQLFILTDNDFKFTGQLQQLSPYSVGTVREYSYGVDFDQATYLNKLPVLSEDLLLKLLLGKRIDMMIGNPLAFDDLISKMQVDSQVKAINPYISLTPVYMALTREREDYKHILQTFKTRIEELKASTYYQYLLNKYKLHKKQ